MRGTGAQAGGGGEDESELASRLFFEDRAGDAGADQEGKSGKGARRKKAKGEDADEADLAALLFGGAAPPEAQPGTQPEVRAPQLHPAPTAGCRCGLRRGAHSSRAEGALQGDDGDEDEEAGRGVSGEECEESGGEEEGGGRAGGGAAWHDGDEDEVTVDIAARDRHTRPPPRPHPVAGPRGAHFIRSFIIVRSPADPWPPVPLA